MRETRRVARKLLVLLVTMAAVAVASMQTTAAKEPIRIAFVDPLSGPFANVGDFGYKHWLYLAEHLNAQGGIDGRQVEIVPFDNKGSPQESLIVLRRVVDEGIQYITQGLGSHVTGALISGIEKHNSRSPKRPILLLNYAAQDTQFFNDLCSYWHIGLDANLDMRVGAVVQYIADHRDIDKVFLLNQDYAYGQGWSRQARKLLAEKAPYVQVVGDVLHPIGKVKDFAPYASQIKQSGAQAVLTGNWGNDLTLLIRAGADAALDVKYFTQAAAGLGAPTAIGKAGNDKVFVISTYYRDLPIDAKAPQWFLDFIQGFEKRYAGDHYYWYYPQMVWLTQMLKQAIEKTGSIDPTVVVAAMEEVPYQTPFGEAHLRRSDHQFLQPLFLSRFSDAAAVDIEGTGLGFVSARKLTAAESAVQTNCKMKRPD